ncbi:hypothetical protein [Kribbella sp. CA-247076]|uniref:hypothetical protein n=1 Tax=Kribbella sp. CA-247076 TaxID=3239941 RepID=UPI003D8FAED9
MAYPGIDGPQSNAARIRGAAGALYSAQRLLESVAQPSPEEWTADLDALSRLVTAAEALAVCLADRRPESGVSEHDARLLVSAGELLQKAGLILADQATRLPGSPLANGDPAVRPTAPDATGA